jgi:farnesyl diphosphate synthase
MSESTTVAVQAERCRGLVDRVEAALKAHLTAGQGDGDLLHQAMQYAVFNGGKRLRPLLVYATGLALGLEPEELDAPACAVELIHCYSLVHDDLPAMDDDDLRRGRPTTHLAFDEATAILAGDALQALAFEILANDTRLSRQPAAGLAMIAELTRACGANGMAGGQSLDLQMEGRRPDQQAVEHMFALKTGALIRASVLMPCALVADPPARCTTALRRFADAIGLAFQIRDDLLDIEGQTEILGKAAGADQAHDKASWPALFGVEAARTRITDLKDEADRCLAAVDGDTQLLEWLGERLVQRDY